jgi:hypothetical protein
VKISAAMLGLALVGGLTLSGVQSCSIPSLETVECIQAREALRSFYSFHFDNGMTPSAEGLERRKDFLTPRYREELASGLTHTDVFTGSEDTPRTFKIGKCESTGSDLAEVQVQVYWRDDQSTRQKEVKARVLRINDKWLIDKVLY